MCFFMPYFMYRPVNFETMSGLNISDRTKTGCVVAACAILSTNFYVMFNSYKVNHKPPPTTATRNQSWIQSTKKSSSSNKRAHNTWFFTGNGCKSCITTMMMMMVVVVCVSRLCYAPFFFFFFFYLGTPAHTGGWHFVLEFALLGVPFGALSLALETDARQAARKESPGRNIRPHRWRRVLGGMPTSALSHTGGTGKSGKRSRDQPLQPHFVYPYQQEAPHLLLSLPTGGERSWALIFQPHSS